MDNNRKRRYTASSAITCAEILLALLADKDCGPRSTTAMYWNITEMLTPTRSCAQRCDGTRQKLKGGRPRRRYAGCRVPGVSLKSSPRLRYRLSLKPMQKTGSGVCYFCHDCCFRLPKRLRLGCRQRRGTPATRLSLAPGNPGGRDTNPRHNFSQLPGGLPGRDIGDRYI